MADRLFYEHTIASLASRRDFDRDAYYEEISLDGSDGRCTSPVGRSSPKRVCSSAVDDRSVASSKSSEAFRRSQRRTVAAAQESKSMLLTTSTSPIRYRPTTPSGNVSSGRKTPTGSIIRSVTPSGVRSRYMDHYFSPGRKTPTSQLSSTSNTPNRRPGSPQRPMSPYKPITPKTMSSITTKPSPESSITQPQQRKLGSAFRPKSPTKLTYSTNDAPPFRLYSSEKVQTPKKKTMKSGGVENKSAPKNMGAEKKRVGTTRPVIPSSAQKTTPPKKETSIDDELTDALGDNTEKQTTATLVDPVQIKEGESSSAHQVFKSDDGENDKTKTIVSDGSETANNTSVTTTEVSEADTTSEAFQSSGTQPYDENREENNNNNESFGTGDQNNSDDTSEKVESSSKDSVNDSEVQVECTEQTDQIDDTTDKTSQEDPANGTNLESATLPSTDRADEVQHEESKKSIDSNQVKKEVSIQNHISSSNSVASTQESDTHSTVQGSDKRKSKSRNSSKNGIIQSILKSEKGTSKANQRNRSKPTTPVLISCKFNPSRGFKDFQVRKHKKVYRGLADFEKGKITSESLAQVIIEELFDRDFWPGKHWKIDAAQVKECGDSENPAFEAEKTAVWDWKDIYSEASATAVIRFLPDRILVENYAYQVAG